MYVGWLRLLFTARLSPLGQTSMCGWLRAGLHMEGKYVLCVISTYVQRRPPCSVFLRVAQQQQPCGILCSIYTGRKVGFDRPPPVSARVLGYSSCIIGILQRIPTVKGLSETAHGREGVCTGDTRVNSPYHSYITCTDG